jgi:hypothetical protein
MQNEFIRNFPGKIVPAIPEKDFSMKIQANISGND